MRNSCGRAGLDDATATAIRGGNAARLLDCPFDAVPVREALWWHPVHTHDAGHVWLRELASAVAAKIGTLRSF